MLIALFTIAAFAAGLVIFAGSALFVLARPIAMDPASLEIDPRRYKPMERLLQNGDMEFAARQGLDRRSIGRLRAQRRAIFRKYLRALRIDFGRIVSGVRLVMVESMQPRPDLVTAMMRARLSFGCNLLFMEMRLCLHAMGLNGIAIDVRPALHLLEVVRRELEITVQPRVTA